MDLRKRYEEQKKEEKLICPDCTTEFEISWINQNNAILSYCAFCGHEFEEEELGEGEDDDIKEENEEVWR